MKQKIIKIGNSVGITLPMQVRESLGLQVGDMLLVERKDDSILLRVPQQSEKKARGGVTAKFMKMVDDFVSEHKDVLDELSKR